MNDQAVSVARTASEAESPDALPAPDDDLFATDDSAFNRPRRMNRTTKVLLAGLMAAAGFAGGVTAQKSHDASIVSAASSVSSALRNRSASGFGSGSSGAAAGGAASGGAGFPAGGAASGGAGLPAAADAGPVAVGTLHAATGTTLELVNLAGTTVHVTISPTTTITLIGTTSLSPGALLSVSGTKAADGSVDATSITVRRPTT
jgi:hypothetical protein